MITDHSFFVNYTATGSSTTWNELGKRATEERASMKRSSVVMGQKVNTP